MPIILDAHDAAGWPVDPVEPIVEDLINKGDRGILSALPKDGKSILAKDLSIHLAHGAAPWLGEFNVRPTTVLYIACEDPLQRIQARLEELNASYGYPGIPKGRLHFPTKDHQRFNLFNQNNLDWLSEVVSQYGIQFLVLDPLARMIEEKDVNSAVDVAKINKALDSIQEELGLTILIIDHHHKPYGRGNHVTPLSISGSIQKWAGADFTRTLSKRGKNLIQLSCANKDTDKEFQLIIAKAPKGSGKPKFTIIGEIDALATGMRSRGHITQMRVLAALDGRWQSSSQIATKLTLGDSTVRKHLGALLKAGLVEKRGRTKNSQWRKV